MAACPRETTALLGAKKRSCQSSSDRSGRYTRIMAWLTLPVFAVLAVLHTQSMTQPGAFMVHAQDIPRQAQVIDQKSFNVWPNGLVPPSTVANGSQIFVPPGISTDDLHAKPFHVYDDEFYSIIGTDPTLTLLAETASDPVYHEAVVW